MMGFVLAFAGLSFIFYYIKHNRSVASYSRGGFIAILAIAAVFVSFISVILAIIGVFDSFTDLRKKIEEGGKN